MSEQTWLLDRRWDAVPRLRLDSIVRRCPRVVVVARHPGDHTLALGATLADLAASGADITAVVANRCELPETGPATYEADLLDRLGTLVDGTTLLIAPVEHDGPADQEALARAAVAAATELGATLLQYPVLLWHWVHPDDIDWGRLRQLAPSLDGLKTKSEALDRYAPDVDDSASPVRARCVIETVFVPEAVDLAARVADDVEAHRTAPEVALPFDAMYTHSDDPWGLDDSVYERRRLDLVLACLGREHYSSVLDIGCASGQLCALLQHRADDVTGLDASPKALTVARARTPGPRWILGVAPRDIPEETFDLIVLSEVAYFLDGPDLLAALRGVRRALRPGGEIVLANWRHPTEHIPLDGPTAHRQAAAMLDLPHRAHYEDADLRIDVWGAPVSVYRDSHRS